MKSANRRTLAVGLACAAALSSVVVITPAANAAANRRVCVYGLSINRLTAVGTVKMYGVNYKKDGGCPKNTNRASRDAGALENANDGKWKCEQVRDELDWGVDPCTEMTADQVYVLETKSNGEQRVRSQFRSFGHY